MFQLKFVYLESLNLNERNREIDISLVGSKYGKIIKRVVVACKVVLIEWEINLWI
jgi:hypothetical protein